MSNNHFTLNIRLTKGCNADCSYCSSWVDNPKRMSVDDFKSSIDFLLSEYFPRINSGNDRHISVQYVGGELLTIPSSEMKESVHYARVRLSEAFTEMTDGAQTNLIGSWTKVRSLLNLFANRVSTSIDHFTDARTVNGSPEKYRQIFDASENIILRKKDRKLPAILVVERGSQPFLMDEFRHAETENRDITLRAVFSGGKDVSGIALTPDEIAESYVEAFDNWVMKSNISVEPFTRLLTGRLIERGATGLFSVYGGCSGCPFQNDCARVSLNLEPNGDLYLCLDTADGDHLKLGNAIEGRFDWDLWSRIDARSRNLDAKCQVCPWRETCHGGCLSESIEAGLGINGRTPLCAVWTALFLRIDAIIDKHGIEEVETWLKTITE